MDLNQAILLTGVQFVVETVKLDLIKVFLRFNKHVLNVLEVEKRLQILVKTVMVKVKNKLQKNYQ